MALRRNIKRLGAAERGKLIRGLKALKSSGEYDKLVKIYAAHAGDVARGPAFLPWHRALLMELERALQDALDDQSFGLPYWDWVADAALPAPASSFLWGPDLFGGSGAPISTGAFAGPGWAAIDRAGAPLGGLARALGGESGTDGAALPGRKALDAALALESYDAAPWDGSSEASFRRALEDLSSAVHRWVFGAVDQPAPAANDPAFWLHACNVDRIWAQWQRARPSTGYMPKAGARPGHHLGDPLLPWDGQHGAVAHTTESVLAPTTHEYDHFYAITRIVVVTKTATALFSGTDDPVTLTLFGPSSGVAFELSAAHCDHKDPFETGQKDTFTFTEVRDRATGEPIDVESLTYFTLRKGTATRTGDWRVAGVTIRADNLVIYDNSSLDVKLIQTEPRFTDKLSHVEF